MHNAPIYRIAVYTSILIFNHNLNNSKYILIIQSICILVFNYSYNKSKYILIIHSIYLLFIVLLFISSFMYTFITDKLVNSLTNKLYEFIKLVINNNKFN